MSYIMLIIGAFCCTLAAFWYPGRTAGGPWYGSFHLGWFGMALYLWSIVLSGAGNIHIGR
jgi:hypothetical protein